MHFTKKSLRRRILREAHGRQVVKITREELKQVLREGLFDFLKGPQPSTPVGPDTDAAKLYAAFQLEVKPDTDPDFVEVMQRRALDIPTLNSEFKAHLESMGESGDLSSFLKMKGMTFEAAHVQRMLSQGHSNLKTYRKLALREGSGMLRQMIHEIELPDPGPEPAVRRSYSRSTPPEQLSGPELAGTYARIKVHDQFSQSEGVYEDDDEILEVSTGDLNADHPHAPIPMPFDMPYPP